MTCSLSKWHLSFEQDPPSGAQEGLFFLTMNTVHSSVAIANFWVVVMDSRVRAKEL